MILYEKNRFGLENSFSVGISKNLNFGHHIHRCFEFVYVSEGEALVEIDTQKKLIKQGDAALIMPYQVHSYNTQISSELVLIIFSPNLVGEFSTFIENRFPASNFFHINDFNYGKVLENNNIFNIKSILYNICGIFFENVRFEEKKEKLKARLDLMHDILLYIEESFQKECSLKDLARHLGYDYSYLSRFFTNNIKMSFTEYVNQCRVNYACYLLKNSSYSITEISEKCGFNSIRSFNRNFMKIMGVAPRIYRQNVENQES